MINNGTIDTMLKNNIDGNDLLHNIWQFRECMLLCESPQKISNDIVKHLWVPYMCTCAFVCELEIKYICFTYGIHFSHCHDLKRLFKLLPAEMKKSIQNQFVIKNLNFQKLLHDYSETFYLWRYKYEYSRIGVLDKNFLKLLENILHEEVLKIRNR